MLVGELSIERAELVGQVIARAVTPQRVHKDLGYTADKLGLGQLIVALLEHLLLRHLLEQRHSFADCAPVEINTAHTAYPLFHRIHSLQSDCPELSRPRSPVSLSSVIPDNPKQ